MKSGKTSPKPDDHHRDKLKARADHAFQKKPTPSQHRSELMRKRLRRGIPVAAPKESDLKPVVVNMRTCTDWGKPGDVRIDRQTKWGNPFQMQNNSAEERNRVCDAYVQWFIQQEKSRSLDILELIDAKRLGCWCFPDRCHGDYLAHRIACERRNTCMKKEEQNVKQP